jgi:hypothetical protein
VSPPASPDDDADDDLSDAPLGGGTLAALLAPGASGPAAPPSGSTATALFRAMHAMQPQAGAPSGPVTLGHLIQLAQQYGDPRGRGAAASSPPTPAGAALLRGLMPPPAPSVPASAPDGAAPATPASSAAASPLPNDSRINRFFNVLDSRLSDAATNLGVPRHYLQGLAAFESSYYDDPSPSRANPLGLTNAGKEKLSFPSADDAIAYWQKLYGGQVRGATSPEDFAQRLQGMRDGKPVAGWNRYNSDDNAWIPKLVGVINSVDRHRQTWQSQQNFDR